MGERENLHKTERLVTRRDVLKALLLLSGLPAAGCVPNDQIQESILTEASEVSQAESRLISPGGPLPVRMNGMNFPSWQQGEYQSSAAQESLRNVKEVNPNFIGIGPVLYQDTIHSTQIGPTSNTATDRDLEFVIDQAHKLGYSVMFLPRINLFQDPDNWHGNIGQGFTETQWQDWFGSYRDMIYHYAELAEKNGVELFVAGNEYLSTSGRDQDWVNTVRGIRSKYSGPLTYAAHHFEVGSLRWWSELDLVGVNPYDELTNKNNPTLSELGTSWKQIAAKLEPTVKRWRKKLVFPEIGYPSVDGANREPWNYRLITDPNVQVDIEEQANCIFALYDALWSKDWWYGVSWWHWHTDPNVRGSRDKNYTPRGKQAASVIRAYGNLTRQRGYRGGG